MKAFQCVVFSLTCIFGSVSDAKVGDSFSTRDLVALAISKSPELRALGLDAEASKYTADQASRWSNPTLEVGGAHKEEPSGHTNFTKFGLSQTIERPGTIDARTRSANAKAEFAMLTKTSSELELRAHVLNLIYEFKTANEKANHAKERLERFQTVGTFLRSRVFASPQKRAEATIVRAKLLILGKALRDLEANRKIAWNKLNLYLDLKSEPEIKVEWYKSAPPIQLENMLAELEKANPELKRQSKKIAQAHGELDMARLESWPGLTLSGSYENGTGANPEKIYGLGISFPIPVFDAKGSSIRSQRSLIEAEQERHKWILAVVTQDLKSEIENYNAARSSLADLRMSEIPKYEQDMTAIDNGFKKGQVDLLTYIEADAEHTESLNAILDAQVAFVEAQTSLFLLVGQSPRILE